MKDASFTGNPQRKNGKILKGHLEINDRSIKPKVRLIKLENFQWHFSPEYKMWRDSSQGYQCRYRNIIQIRGIILIDFSFTNFKFIFKFT